MADGLQQSIDRVKAGSREEADLQAIVAAIASGRLVLADASGVGVGGNIQIQDKPPLP